MNDKCSILLGHSAPREKIVRRIRESTRGEISSEDRKYSMSDSKLVDAFLDAMRLDEEEGGEGHKEDIRREFRSLVLPMLLCHAAGEGSPVPSVLLYHCFRKRPSSAGVLEVRRQPELCRLRQSFSLAHCCL